MVCLEITKSHDEEGLQCLHVFVKISLELIGNGACRTEGLLVAGGVLRLEHSKDIRHDTVRVGEDVLLGHLQAQDLDDAAQQTLETLLVFLIVVRQNLHVESLGKPIDDGREELHKDGLDIRSRNLDEHADSLKCNNTKVALDGIFSVSHLKKCLKELGHVTGQGIGIIGIRIVSKGGRNGVQAKAGLGGDAGSLTEKLAGEGVDEGGEGLGGDRSDVHFTDLANDPRRGILHHNVGIRRQSLEQDGDALVDVRGDGVRIRSGEDGTKGHGCSLPKLPVLALDVVLNEWHDDRNDEVLDGLGNELKARRGGHGQSPLLLLDVDVVLVLGHGLGEEGGQMLQCRGNVLDANPVGIDGDSPLGGIGRLVEELLLLLAEGRPELDGLERHDLLVGPDGVERQLEDGLHVVVQVVVVLEGDLDDALVGSRSGLGVLGLGGLADGLHDHVALGGSFHVLAGEEEGVAQGIGGGAADGVGPVGSDAIDDGREHLVGGLVVDGRTGLDLTQPLAGEAQAFQRGNLDAVAGIAGDVGQEGGEEFRPLVVGQFDGRHLGGRLRGRMPCNLLPAAEGLQQQSLDGRPRLAVQSLPLVVLGGLDGLVLGIQEILKVDASQLPNGGGPVLASELRGQCAGKVEEVLLLGLRQGLLGLSTDRKVCGY